GPSGRSARANRRRTSRSNRRGRAARSGAPPEDDDRDVVTRLAALALQRLLEQLVRDPLGAVAVGALQDPDGPGLVGLTAPVPRLEQAVGEEHEAVAGANRRARVPQLQLVQ